jgi:hypothetical protein
MVVRRIAEPVVSHGVGLPLRQGPAGGGIDLDGPGAVSHGGENRWTRGDRFARSAIESGRYGLAPSVGASTVGSGVRPWPRVLIGFILTS